MNIASTLCRNLAACAAGFLAALLPALPAHAADGGSPSGNTFTYTPTSIFGTTNPRAPLVLGKDGNYYGTTQSGGTYNNGTFYRLTPHGKMKILHSFGADMAYPTHPPLNGWLTMDADGNFYGTQTGQVGGWGSTQVGMVYRINTSGKLTKVYEDTTGTVLPGDGVTLATDGNFYGSGSGSASGIFRLSRSGKYTVVMPWSVYQSGTGLSNVPGKLTEAFGYFWGSVGADNYGNNSAIFRLQVNGNGSTASIFPCISGSGDGTGNNGVCAGPGNLVVGPDNALYGPCNLCNWLSIPCWPEGYCDVFPGGIFKITATGQITLLHGFYPDGNGAWPTQELVLASDGKFYGSTSWTLNADGTGNAMGHFFSMTPDGTLTNIVDNLLTPSVAMIQGSDGKLHGVNWSDAFTLSSPRLVKSYKNMQ